MRLLLGSVGCKSCRQAGRMSSWRAKSALVCISVVFFGGNWTRCPGGRNRISKSNSRIIIVQLSWIKALSVFIVWSLLRISKIAVLMGLHTLYDTLRLVWKCKVWCTTLTASLGFLHSTPTCLVSSTILICVSEIWCTLMQICWVPSSVFTSGQ